MSGDAYVPNSADPGVTTDDISGSDVLYGSETIRKHFPFVAPNAVAALHARRHVNTT